MRNMLVLVTGFVPFNVDPLREAVAIRRPKHDGLLSFFDVVLSSVREAIRDVLNHLVIYAKQVSDTRLEHLRSATSFAGLRLVFEVRWSLCRCHQ